jgi:hypothetical protein
MGSVHSLGPTSAKDPLFSLVKKKFDAYSKLTVLVMEQRDWWDKDLRC